MVKLQLKFSDVRSNFLFGNEIVVNRNNELKTLQIPEDFLGNLVDSDAKRIIEYSKASSCWKNTRIIS